MYERAWTIRSAGVFAVAAAGALGASIGVHAGVVTYASIQVGQSPGEHYAPYLPTSTIISQVSSNGRRVGSPFVATQSGGITEIGAWLYTAQSTTPLLATVELFSAGPDNLPGNLLGTFSMPTQLKTSSQPSGAPPRLTADGSVFVEAGQKYYLIASALRSPNVPLEWLAPIEVPGAGTTPVDVVLGNPDTGGIAWSRLIPTDSTALWNPVGFWITVPPPGSGAVVILGLLPAISRRRHTC